MSMLKIKIGTGNGTLEKLVLFCAQGLVVLMVTSQLHLPMMLTFGFFSLVEPVEVAQQAWHGQVLFAGPTRL